MRAVRADPDYSYFVTHRLVLSSHSDRMPPRRAAAAPDSEYERLRLANIARNDAVGRPLSSLLPSPPGAPLLLLLLPTHQQLPRATQPLFFTTFWLSLALLTWQVLDGLGLGPRAVSLPPAASRSSQGRSSRSRTTTPPSRTRRSTRSAAQPDVFVARPSRTRNGDQDEEDDTPAQGEADEEDDDEEDDPDYDADDNNNNDQEDDDGDSEDGESSGRAVLAAPTSSIHNTIAVRQASDEIQGIIADSLNRRQKKEARSASKACKATDRAELTAVKARQVGKIGLGWFSEMKQGDGTKGAASLSTGRLSPSTSRLRAATPNRSTIHSKYGKTAFAGWSDAEHNFACRLIELFEIGALPITKDTSLMTVLSKVNLLWTRIYLQPPHASI